MNKREKEGVGGANENSEKVWNASKGAMFASRTEGWPWYNCATIPELWQKAGAAAAAAQTIKPSVANTTERTGTNTGLNSINPRRYT
jgi:hypothetical protein